MALINCTTKGCLQTSEAKLDEATDEVICDNCGNPIEGLSVIMKRSLKQQRQVIRHKKTQPFQQNCTVCQSHQSLYVKGSEAFCEACNTQIHVTPSFLQGLKLHIERQGKFKNDGVE